MARSEGVTKISLAFVLFYCIYFSVISCGPIIPLQSTAEIRYIYYSYTDMYQEYGGETIETGFMELFTDMLNYKLFLNSSAYDTIAPSANAVLNASLLYQYNQPTYETTNRQCYKSGNAYGDFYWWIQYSNFEYNLPCPSDTSTTCSFYSYSYQDDTYMTYFSVILTSKNYIQQLNITDYYQHYGFTIELGYLAMNFHSFQPSIIGNPFTAPSICSYQQSEFFFCSPGEHALQTVYFLHDYDDYDMGTNVGDLLGYTAYLCWKSSVGDDLILTQAVVEMNTTWGQYATCYSPTDCIGGNAVSVGRECPYGFFEFQGQCDNLAPYGQWFSLRPEARCPTLSPVGTNGCAWHFRQYVKSISFSCLINRGLFGVCYEDNQIPFNLASEIVSSAFVYCPPVSTSLTEEFDPAHTRESNHLHSNPPTVNRLRSILNRMVTARDRVNK